MEKTGTSKILVIIPCYNEAENVAKLYARLQAVRIENCELHPLFINDCSKDKTLEMLEKIGAKHLDNIVNLGIGGTVQLGFIYAAENGFDFAVQMDGDGQHPPEQLQVLFEPLLKGEVDVVIGSRFISGDGFQSSALRRFGINFFSFLNKVLTGVKIKDSTSGYRAYNSHAFEVFLNYYPDEYPEPEAIIYLANKGMRIKEVAVRMEERQGGVSSIRKFNSIYYMLKVTLNILFLHLKMKING